MEVEGGGLLIGNQCAELLIEGSKNPYRNSQNIFQARRRATTENKNCGGRGTGQTPVLAL